MTTWTDGDRLTPAWMNSLEKILAMGTFADATTPRLTLTPNSTFDIASNLVAVNVRLNGSVAVSSAGHQYEGFSVRTLTSTTDGAAAYATAISVLHTCTPTNGAYAYAYISLLGANGGDNTSKVSGLYQRVTTGSTSQSTFVAGTFAATYDTGASIHATSCLLNLERSGTNVSAYPIGIYVSSNDAGSILNNVFVVDSSLQIGASCFQWNQRASTSAYFTLMYDSNSIIAHNVDNLGNLNFRVAGLTAGQLITGDMTNATQSKRLMFQTATADSNTTLGIRAKGSGTVAALAVYGGSDPDNAPKLQLNSQASGTATLNSAKTGTGVTQNFAIAVNGTGRLYVQSNGDILLGGTGQATTDTSAYMYIQAVAGAPSGTPASNSGYVAMRYDSTNDYLYVYNSGWKKSSVYA